MLDSFNDNLDLAIDKLDIILEEISHVFVQQSNWDKVFKMTSLRYLHEYLECKYLNAYLYNTSYKFQMFSKYMLSLEGYNYLIKIKDELNWITMKILKDCSVINLDTLKNNLKVIHYIYKNINVLNGYNWDKCIVKKEDLPCITKLPKSIDKNYSSLKDIFIDALVNNYSYGEYYHNVVIYLSNHKLSYNIDNLLVSKNFAIEKSFDDTLVEASKYELLRKKGKLDEVTLLYYKTLLANSSLDEFNMYNKWLEKTNEEIKKHKTEELKARKRVLKTILLK